jgi:hypothetical protein
MPTQTLRVPGPADAGPLRDAITIASCVALRRLLSTALLPAGAVLLIGAGSASADVFDDIGFTALKNRIGAANVPTGAGYGVGQVEAEETAGNYGPNTANPEFAGKTFTPQTGAFGTSSHATTVGLALYGNTSSAAPGITNIFVWNANNWATTSFLKVNQAGVPPAIPPAGMRIFNHSWIGSFGSTFLDNDALRRFDFEQNRDNVLSVVGTNNGAGSPPNALVGYGYHAMTVGLANGLHCNALTPAGLDGQNRRKPDIVAPGSFTSFSTPIVGSVAAILFETTDLDPGLATNPNADKATLIKAVMLAGTNHRPGWTNNPATSGPTRGQTSTPLDPLFGADLVNVDRSHYILTGLEQNGSTTVPAQRSIIDRGWDWIPTLASNTSVYYRFTAWAETDEVSVLAAWNRSVSTSFASFTLMDIDLTLHKVNGTSITSLVGDARTFVGGNVSSISTVDNVEHLYVTGLAPGEYVIEVKRKSGAQATLPVALAWYMTDTGPLGDLNDDDFVNAEDLAILLGAWGGNGIGDLNGDSTVDALDLAILLGAWSPEGG